MFGSGSAAARKGDAPAPPPDDGFVLPRPIEIRIPALAREEPAPRLLALGAPPAGPAASTYGWDTVFAVRIEDVNAVLRRPGATPLRFAIRLEDDYAVEGRFGAWQVRPGGGGRNLHFALPIPSGRLRFQGRDYDMSGACAEIELRLRYLPSAANAPDDPGARTEELRVESHPEAGRLEAVSVLRLRFEGAEPAGFAQALMIGGLSEWLNAHIAEFDHIFCSVNLGEQLAAEHAWLAPTATSYAYQDDPDAATGTLGVLCMTQGRSADDAARQLSPGAIPGGARAGFSIAPGLFLREMVVPSLTKAFPGSGVGDFALEPGDGAIVNTGDLALDPISHGGIDYHPVVEKLRLSLVGSELRFETLTRTNISPGIDAYVKNASYLGLRLGRRVDGAPVLTYVQSREPASENWSKVAPGIKVLELVIGIIAAIVIAVLAVLTAGATLVIAVVAVALVAGVAAVTPELIAGIRGQEVAEKVPSIDNLVLNATRGIRFSGARAFRISAAGLNGVLQLGGDPCFAD